jgi:hypothetical protein
MEKRALVFQEYMRKPKSAYLREVTEEDINEFRGFGVIYTDETKTHTISISDADLKSGSPKIGDMVAVNKYNPKDQWLINEGYFHEHFIGEPVRVADSGDLVIVFK